MTLLRRIAVVFDRDNRSELFLALALSFVAALLETLGVLAIPGLVAVLSHPTLALELARRAPLVSAIRFESASDLLLWTTVAVAAFVVV